MVLVLALMGTERMKRGKAGGQYDQCPALQWLLEKQHLPLPPRRPEMNQGCCSALWPGDLDHPGGGRAAATAGLSLRAPLDLTPVLSGDCESSAPQTESENIWLCDLPALGFSSPIWAMDVPSEGQG